MRQHALKAGHTGRRNTGRREPSVSLAVPACHSVAKRPSKYRFAGAFCFQAYERALRVRLRPDLRCLEAEDASGINDFLAAVGADTRLFKGGVRYENGDNVCAL